jgi:TRAP-type transport system periplasmic protein
MMKKSFLSILATVLMLMPTFANGTKDASNAKQTGTTDNTAKTYSLNVSTVLTATDPISVGLNKLAETVGKDTNGAIKVTVYPSSQLGDTADVLEQAKGGANVGVIIDTGMLADYVPDMAIYTGPYVFTSVENARKFIDTDLFKSWDTQLSTHGLRDLGCNWYQGARNFLTNKKVTTPDDLKGMRVRTMGSTVAQESMKAFGAVPTSLAWSEAYSGLQSKVVDSVEAQTTAVYGSSLFEVTKYLAKTEHFLLYTGLVISDKWFQTLPANYQQILIKDARAAGDYATQLTLQKEKEYNAEMAKKGLIFVDVDKKPFIAASAAVYKKMGWTDLKKQIDTALGQ